MTPSTASPSSTTSRRAARGLVSVAAAGALALGVGVLPGVLDGAPPRAAAAGHHATPGSVSAKEVALRQAMRGLWQEHIVWTRQVIVDFAAGLPNLDASSARLLQNQTDIGDAVAGYYGAAAGKALTAKLRQHILIAVDVLKAAKAGDSAALADAQARWNTNADDIADFLSSANPKAWKRAEMRRMMRGHLDLTTKEAVARLTGDAAGDVKAYQKVQTQAMEMADMLSSGIVAQFPKRFRSPPA